MSGPQIGILKRVFVIDTTPISNDEDLIKKYERAFINPVILDQSKLTEKYIEGCLSIPGIYEEVERPGRIWVRYQDLMLHCIEEELNGLIARIFQHEYDHLQGILFIDKLSQLRRTLLRGKLNEIKRSL